MGWQLLTRATVTEVQSDKRLTGIMLSVSALGLLLILFFKGALLPLLEFVMILAFMTTVVFAWLNYRLMTSSQLPEADRYGTKMKCLSWIGLSYLLIFAVLFIYWYRVKA